MQDGFKLRETKQIKFKGLKMKKLTTILLTGFATLAFTACGGSSSSSGGSTPPSQPIEEESPSLHNGSQTMQSGETKLMYVNETGNVSFNWTYTGNCTMHAYDANYNPYNKMYSILRPTNYIYSGDTYEFEPGEYNMYFECGSHNESTITILSSVVN